MIFTLVSIDKVQDMYICHSGIEMCMREQKCAQAFDNIYLFINQKLSIYKQGK